MAGEQWRRVGSIMNLGAENEDIHGGVYFLKPFVDVVLHF